MSRETIIANVTIESVLAARGIEPAKRGAKELAYRCPFHDDKTPSMAVNVDKRLWKCHGCGLGGSVIDLVMQFDGCGASEAMQRLEPDRKPLATVKPEAKAEAMRAEIVATYDYRDEVGRLLYQVVRFNPKTFRQRHDVDGKWVWSLDGVRRVLFRLPELAGAQEVWVCEGEKDALTLVRLGLCATCNSGGAGKWMDGYTDSLAGKDVVIVPDNDEPGRKHAELVRESLAGKVASVRQIEVPAPHKDVSDYVSAVGDVDGQELLVRLRDKATVMRRGLDIPVHTMADLEREYRAFVTRPESGALTLARWLPSFSDVRPVLPGEVVTLLADTGVGKTALLQNLCLHARPLTCLLFEIEMPGTLTFERFAALANKQGCSVVELGYKNGHAVSLDKLSHVYVCPLSRMDLPTMEKIIVQSELVIGKRPDVVLVDYIGLMQGHRSGSRYERMSATAEEMKGMAKACGVILVIASQVHRPQGDVAKPRVEVTLHDAKDTGSIENTADLLLGAWRDPADKTILRLRVLKNRKGQAGKTVDCVFNGATMQISEQARKWEREQ